uniref:Uncharacterized protein ORF33 n=1 Tax=Janthinobacterium sp. (strain J3) TaxID=213804 RepID=Q84IH8_JANS3|nr:hypothetical protein [Janthinobacterium sp. J3]
MDEKTEFAWDDSYLLGHHAMDTVHREFVDLLQAALTAPNAELPHALADIARHAEGHFAQENEWMVSQEFPGGDCHIDEHNKVLASIYDVQEKVIQGDIAIGRKLAQALSEWFPDHASFMDSALAAWLVRRTYGGSPIVLRRATQRSKVC